MTRVVINFVDGEVLYADVADLSFDVPMLEADRLTALDGGPGDLDLLLDSKVERSSGFRRLDEAARAGLSQCKFRPATVNGKPERSWGRIEYVWKLE